MSENEEKRKRLTRPQTINRELSLLKAMYNLALRWGKYSGINPVSLAGSVSDTESFTARPLSEEEAAMLFESCPVETRPIFEFAVATGIRIGRILALTWDQVDIQERTIRLRRKSKQREPMVLPLSDWALDILKTMPRHLRSPYVFSRPDGERYKCLKSGFKNALKRAGLDNSIRIHDLRHTYDTWLHARGTPTAVVRDLMGQRTLTMASHYNQSSVDSMLHFAGKITRPTVEHANHIANNERK